LRKSIARVLLLLGPVLSLNAEDTGAASSDTPTDIRREMASEYRFSAPGKKADPLPSSLNSSSTGIPTIPSAAGKDVVAMAPFEVRESGSSAVPVLSPEGGAPQGSRATVAEKLGIGTHYAKLGKVRVFVSTVFFIPVLAGFDW
jgi:hypothetical protein